MLEPNLGSPKAGGRLLSCSSRWSSFFSLGVLFVSFFFVFFFCFFFWGGARGVWFLDVFFNYIDI